MSEKHSVVTTSNKTLYDYWMALYRRRAMILLLVAVSLVSSLLISSQTRAIYSAEAWFYILRSVSGNPESGREFAVAMPLLDGGTIHAFAEIMNGRDARTQVLADFPGVELDDLPERPIVTAQPSGMLVVRIENHDPQLAADLANAFVAYFRKIVSTPTENTSIEQRSRLESELAEVNRMIEASRDGKAVIYSDSGADEATVELAALQQNEFKLDEQIREMELRMDSVAQEIESLRMTALRERRIVLMSEVEGLKIRLAGLKRIRADLNAQIRRATALAADLELEEATIDSLRRRQATLERSLDTLNLGSLIERRLELVTQTALPSNRPVLPNTEESALVAVVISLTLGLLLAIALEMRDTRRSERLSERRRFERRASRLLISEQAPSQPVEAPS